MATIERTNLNKPVKAASLMVYIKRLLLLIKSKVVMNATSIGHHVHRQSFEQKQQARIKEIPVPFDLLSRNNSANQFIALYMIVLA